MALAFTSEAALEAKCQYISSRGFMGLCDIRPTINRRTVYDYNKCDYLARWGASASQGASRVVYVCSDVLGWFVDTIVPQIRGPFVLMSGDSDALVPREVMTGDQLRRLVECRFCCAWYAQNWVGVGRLPTAGPIPDSVAMKKVVSLPIGMDYHTATHGAGLINEWGVIPTPEKQERVLQTIRAEAPEWLARRGEIFCNVQHRLDKWGDRERAIRAMPVGLVVFVEKKEREATWREMIKYRYVLSPFGNGYDCHRVWESLLLGCVPIVCTNGEREYKRLWEGLPVLCVDRWSDVTERVLSDFSIEYETHAHDRLRLAWWRSQIRDIFRNHQPNVGTYGATGPAGSGPVP